MDPNKIFGNAAKYATTQSGQTIAPVEEFKGKAPDVKRSSGGALIDFVKGIGLAGAQTVQIGGQAVSGITKFIGRTAASTVLGIYDTADAVSKSIFNTYGKDLDYVNRQNEQASLMFEQATRDYRAGRMNKEAYNRALADYNETLKQSNDTIKRTMRSVDKSDFVKDAAITLSTILSFGSYSPITGVAPKSINPALLGGKQSGAVFDAANKLDDLVAKIPSVKDLLIRNGAKGVERGVINQSTRDALSAVIIKQPFVYHSTVDDVEAIARDLASGKYGAAAARAGFVTTLAFDGGIFGKALTGAKKVGTAGKRTLFGVGSTVDELGRVLKESSPTAIHELLDGLKTGTYKAGQKLSRNERNAIKYLERHGADKVEETLRLFNESMLQSTKDDVHEVIRRLAEDNQKRLGRSISEVSAAEWVAQNLKYQEAAQRLVEVASAGRIKGIDPMDARKLALAVFDKSSKKQLIQAMSKLDTKFDRIKFIEEMINSGKAPHYLQNTDMQFAILKMVNKYESKDALIKQINSMTSGIALKGIPKKLAKEMAQEGYVVIKPFKRESPFVTLDEARNLTTAFENSFNWEPSFAPNKTLRVIGGRLRKMGLSPEDTSRVAYDKLKSNLDEGFKQLDIGLDSETTLKDLRNFAERKKAVTDLRMLRTNEVMQALNIDKAAAKNVMNAIHQAHLQIPLELRGLADRVVDKMYKYAPYFKYQSRIQSGGRYAYNPFFKLQENVETELLSQLGTGGKIPSFPLIDDMAERLFPNYYDKIDDASEQLKKAGIFSETFSGAGADDVVIGRITANMTKSQRRSLSGYALKIADKKGTDLATLLAREPDVIEDALRIVVQYPKKGAINSPLVKMMNLAVFPTRYNLKVANLAAKEIAKLPPSIQVAMTTSLMDFPDWLKSEEGLAWRQEHDEGIKLMNWLTPIGSLQAIAKAATGDFDKVSELGMLGALPFGWIGQVLDSQGIIDMSSPYVNIKTGDVYTRELPENAKGRVYLATIDLLNQLFTYPGRTVGLPGKRELLRNVSGELTGIQRGKDTRFEDQEPYLTEQQKQLIEMIRKQKQQSGEPDTTISYYTIPIMTQLDLDREGQPVLPKSQRPKKARKSGSSQTVADTTALGL